MDTGVLVSALVFGGTPRKAVVKAFIESDLYVSPALLAEYRDVPLQLEVQGKVDRVELKALIAGIAAFVSKATIVKPIKELRICRDRKDDMLIECCLAANADVLVTGDKDLLNIPKLPIRLRILSPRSYLES